jgi:hypothetical protein
MFKKFRRLVMVVYISFVIPVKSALPSIMDWKSKIAWYPFAREPEYRLLFSLPRYSLLKSIAIQPRYEMNGNNREREINGLLAALKSFNLSEGIILTIDQTDKILTDGFKINVVSAYKFVELKETLPFS